METQLPQQFFFIDVIVLRSSRTFYNTAAAAPSPLCADSQMLPPHRWPFAAAAHCSYSSLNTLFALYTQRRAVLRPAIFLPVLRQQIWRTVSINYFHSIIILIYYDRVSVHVVNIILFVLCTRLIEFCYRNCRPKAEKRIRQATIWCRYRPPASEPLLCNVRQLTD